MVEQFRINAGKIESLISMYYIYQSPATIMTQESQLAGSNPNYSPSQIPQNFKKINDVEQCFTN
jgi:hypothetical protein